MGQSGTRSSEGTVRKHSYQHRPSSVQLFVGRGTEAGARTEQNLGLGFPNSWQQLRALPSMIISTEGPMKENWLRRREEKKHGLLVRVNIIANTLFSKLSGHFLD